MSRTLLARDIMKFPVEAPLRWDGFTLKTDSSGSQTSAEYVIADTVPAGLPDARQLLDSDYITKDVSTVNELKLETTSKVVHGEAPTLSSVVDNIPSFSNTDYDIEDSGISLAALQALLPPAAPSLSDISVTSGNGQNGSLSFGPSNAISGYSDVDGGLDGSAAFDVNGFFNYDSGGKRLGIYSASADRSGRLNDDVTSPAGGNYPNNSFDVTNAAGEGTLEIYVNSLTTPTHSVDLESFASGDTNPGGTGFVLNASDFVEFDNGNDFTGLKYRTGTWRVDTADMRNGWNYVWVRHVIGGANRDTNYWEWVVDADVTATAYSSLSLSGLSMTGNVDLSGVKYHTGGDAIFNATVDKHHMNTFSKILWQFPTTTDCSVDTPGGHNSDDIAAPDWEDQTQVIAANVDINGDGDKRILGTDISVSVRAQRTVQSEGTSSTTSGGWQLLLDNNGSNATAATLEDFNGEDYRLHSGSDFQDLTLVPNWVSTNSLVGASADYNDGLQITEGRLVYPGEGLIDDYSAVTDGPAGNPDYSSASGERYYYRAFTKASGGSALFSMNFDGSFAVISESDVFTPSSNQVKISIKMPNGADGGTYDATTTGTGWLDCNENFATNQWDDGDGCLDASVGSGPGTGAWGLSVGTKNVINTNGNVWLRITMPANGTASITNLQWSFD